MDCRQVLLSTASETAISWAGKALGRARLQQRRLTLSLGAARPKELAQGHAALEFDRARSTRPLVTSPSGRNAAARARPSLGLKCPQRVVFTRPSLRLPVSAISG
jgi:hypothetical protein